uniref:Uncharacterized protein n=1 Tax=Sphaerodactylus townsendi TaxID=933632 RepID=A0ACB8EIS6_9SAUR
MAPKTGGASLQVHVPRTVVEKLTPPTRKRGSGAYYAADPEVASGSTSQVLPSATESRPEELESLFVQHNIKCQAGQVSALSGHISQWHPDSLNTFKIPSGASCQGRGLSGSGGWKRRPACNILRFAPSAASTLHMNITDGGSPPPRLQRRGRISRRGASSAEGSVLGDGVGKAEFVLETGNSRVSLVQFQRPDLLRPASPAFKPFLAVA